VLRHLQAQYKISRINGGWTPSSRTRQHTRSPASDQTP
jgi:hypothetical protein